jgi:hypothetical protein
VSASHRQHQRCPNEHPGPCQHVFIFPCLIGAFRSFVGGVQPLLSSLADNMTLAAESSERLRRLFRLERESGPVPCVLMQTWRHPRSPDPPRVMVLRSAWQIVSSTLDSTQRAKFIGISVGFSLGAKYKNPEREVLGRPRAPLVPVLFPEWGGGGGGQGEL